MSATHSCENCSKVFRDSVTLRRHQNRKVKCTSDRKHKCVQCQKSFSHASTLSRHARRCLPHAEEKSEAQHPTIIVNINTTNNVSHTGGDVKIIQMPQSGASIEMLGWPKNWPAPDVVPRAFIPPSYTITVDVLQKALLQCTSTQIDGCLAGANADLACLLTEVMKLVHAEPQNRNIFLDPNRADQVMVYIPERWQTYTLTHAIGIMFGRVVGTLLEAEETSGDSRVRALIEQLIHTYSNQRSVVSESRKPMSAHLSNLSSQAKSGDWAEGALDAWAAPGSGTDLRFFGEETRLPIPIRETVQRFELMLGVSTEADLAPEQYSHYVTAMAHEFSRLFTRCGLVNLTVLPSAAGAVSVHTPRGWEELPADEAGDRLARHVLTRLRGYIRAHEAGATPLRPLSDYIEAEERQLLRALGGAGGFVLEHFLEAARAGYKRVALPAPGARPTIHQLGRMRMEQLRLEDVFELFGL